MRRAPLGAFCLALALVCAGCSSSLEDAVERLAGTPEEKTRACQDLLLAKEQAVGPLLAALDDPRLAAARPLLVEVLSGLMMRVADDRIEPALLRLLRADPDPRVRAAVATRMGLFARAAAAGPLLQALRDADGQVRHQALLALASLGGRLDSQQQAALRERALALQRDEHPGVRAEAAIHIADLVSERVRQAREHEVRAEMAQAESLYSAALAFSPDSRQASYRLGRFYLDSGQREKGLRLLREHGMLLDVRRLSAAPVIDGRLDEPVWQEAARIDSLFLHTPVHKASLPAEWRTQFRVGYTPDALYVGFRGFDACPDSLVVGVQRFDDYSYGTWKEDRIEVFVDSDFDHKTYMHMSANSRGIATDAWHEHAGTDEYDVSWNARAQAAAHVGADLWSVEYRLEPDGRTVHAPRQGALWGFDCARVFRGGEFGQWVRTFEGNAHAPDEFGVLRFR
ncbi:MAG: HEAT repeat domain-containing protein [Candidatus Latescibacterota bacterium]